MDLRGGLLDLVWRKIPHERTLAVQKASCPVEAAAYSDRLAKMWCRKENINNNSTYSQCVDTLLRRWHITPVVEFVSLAWQGHIRQFRSLPQSLWVSELTLARCAYEMCPKPRLLVVGVSELPDHCNQPPTLVLASINHVDEQRRSPTSTISSRIQRNLTPEGNLLASILSPQEERPSSKLRATNQKSVEASTEPSAVFGTQVNRHYCSD